MVCLRRSVDYSTVVYATIDAIAELLSSGVGTGRRAVENRAARKCSLTDRSSKACGAWSQRSCKTLIVRKGPRNVRSPCWAQGIFEKGFSNGVFETGFPSFN